MNESSRDADRFVVVARAVKTRGLKGEIVADLLTDFPERFDGLSTLITVAPDGQRESVELESHWFQKDRIVLKLKGYDSIEASSSLIGRDFAVPEDERVALEPGAFYEWELHGCRVETVAGESLGTVSGIMRTGGVEMLQIQNENQGDYLVPMAETIVVEIDLDKKRIVIDPPEGLLEL